MRKTADYLKHAQECRVLARNSAKGEQREQLLVMAQTWERLAEERAASGDGNDGASPGPGKGHGSNGADRKG